MSVTPDAVYWPPPELIVAAVDHIRRMGLARETEMPDWHQLSGGVSNWVLRFESGDGVVVKAALAQLRVREEWLADPTRAVLEGRAMRTLGERLPAGDLPRVLFIDERAHLLGMTSAPADAVPWKEALLRGEIDLIVARQVGELLGRMHAAAWGDAGLAEEFGDLQLFHQLRLDPYHERTAQVAEARGDAELATLLRAGSEAMTRDRITLVHGDFSPKNLLVHAGGVLVLDFEVVHWGRPDFDTAFLLTHLALKAIHRPADAASYGQAADAFLRGYAETLGHRDLEAIERGALAQAGCLLLARADGKSPAEYLDESERAMARARGTAVLRGRISTVQALFEREPR